MKIQLWSIGKPHDPDLKNAIEDFTSRIGRYYPVQWQVIPNIKNAATLSSDDLKKKEAAVLLQMISKDDYLVLLDERGKNIDSVQLANLIQLRANESTRQIIFLIGGAFGVDQTIMSRANFTWALSNLIFPHQLVRLILSEQVYRACTILRNERYHHE
ncbi:MAG: 23S rRNA (pseudouridine(1915)-N(3))-methyltransferase RlmH [Flavitalea sp.]